MKCDNDCFHCSFPDCIRTFSEYEMYPEKFKRYAASNKGRENEKRKSKRKIESGKNAEYCRRYYQKHREEILQKKKEAREKCKKENHLKI